jgi:hypothetical protein
MTMIRPRSSAVRGTFPSMAMLAFSLAVSSAYAQASPSPIPEALQDKALMVTVQTLVAASSTTPAWEAKETKSTLSGSSVTVKLVGESLVVLVQVTPYQNPDGLILVTQAQVWIKDDDKIHYRSVMNTLRVAYGEPVVFYPLGEGKGKAPLSLVIIVEPYAKPRPPADPVSSGKPSPAAKPDPPAKPEPSAKPEPPIKSDPPEVP